MSDEKHTVELYVVMNPDGEYVVDHDEDAATERFNDDYHGPYEVTKINLKMKAPKPIAREASAELPDNDEGEFTLTLDTK